MQGGLGDPEVFRDLGQRGFASAGDCDHVATELFGERLRHCSILPPSRLIFTAQMSTNAGAVPSDVSLHSDIVRVSQ